MKLGLINSAFAQAGKATRFGLEATKRLGYDGVVSIELEYSPEPERIVEWVAEAKDATAAIMAALACRPATVT